VNQRGVCGHGDFWDIRVDQYGKLFVETDQDSSGTYDDQMHGCASVNDGISHDIVVQRVQGELYSYIDGVFDRSHTSGASFGSLAALQTGLDICDGTMPGDTFAFDSTKGSITNVCVVQASEVQPDAGSCQ